MEDAGIIKILQLISIIVCSVLLLLGIGVFLDNSNIYEQVMSELELIPQIMVIDFTTGPLVFFVKFVLEILNLLE